jgi:hypothetical protein
MMYLCVGLNLSVVRAHFDDKQKYMCIGRSLFNLSRKNTAKLMEFPLSNCQLYKVRSDAKSAVI